MGAFDWLTGGDPSKAANKYLDQIPGTASKYYNPYIKTGKRAMNNLSSEYENLISDPNAIYNKLGEGYTSSPGYDFALKQALASANSAAASGGMAGSPMHEQQSMDVATGLASRDYDNYMKQVLGLYDTGLSGEQDLYHTGFNASDTLAKMLTENLGSKANLAYSGAANKNAATSGLIEALLGGIGAASGMGGMGALGGLLGLGSSNKAPPYLDPLGLF